MLDILHSKSMHIGLILNPIAGIGGRVGLKGSDGVDIQQQAFALGAEKEAQTKAALCLAELTGIKKQIFISTVSGEMGENLCKAQGFEHQVIYQPDRPNKTTESDTAKAAQLLSATDIDLLLFAGGDGTARIILNNVEEEQLCLGIPAGCKIYSGVFAVTPADAGRLICAMQSGALIDMNWSQVLDINEAAYRDAHPSTWSPCASGETVLR
jgi:predicted polyphosphate/ATP-dependent NAD kinase